MRRSWYYCILDGDGCAGGYYYLFLGKGGHQCLGKVGRVMRVDVVCD